MNQEMEFKNIVAQYSKVASEEMNNEMRFREDLGFSSLSGFNRHASNDPELSGTSCCNI